MTPVILVQLVDQWLEVLLQHHPHPPSAGQTSNNPKLELT
jgi:hypothetical protein